MLSKALLSSFSIQNLRSNAQLTVPLTDFPSIPPGFLASGWRVVPKSPATGFTYDILVVGTF